MTNYLRACASLLPHTLTLVAGCSDDGSSTPAYKASCSRNCARAHDCSSTIDAEQCVDDCEDDLEDVGPQLRDDYLAGIDSCVAELSCNELVAASILNTCPMEAAARLGPSKAAQDLCDQVQESLEECLGVSGGASACLDTVKVFADGALRRAADCGSEPCDQRFTCAQEALGVDSLGT
jgi:hypothetical protein